MKKTKKSVRLSLLKMDITVWIKKIGVVGVAAILNSGAPSIKKYFIGCALVQIGNLLKKDSRHTVLEKESDVHLYGEVLECNEQNNYVYSDPILTELEKKVKERKAKLKQDNLFTVKKSLKFTFRNRKIVDKPSPISVDKNIKGYEKSN